MRKALLSLLALTGIVVITVQMLGLSYIWKTLIYNYVDYDDYKIFDNRTIEAGEPWTWPNSTKLGTINTDESLNNYHEEMQTIGFLAIQNDSVIFEKYYRDFDQNTIANSFSVAKSYVSMLVGFAIKDGLINSLDDKVTDYLPDLKNEVFGKISLRNLCTMSSGLEWKESYGGPINHTSEGYYGKDLWKLVSGLELIDEPGSVYKYKGCDPQLLAFVIQKVTDKTLSDYLSEKFWKPTGHSADGLWSLDNADGIEKAYCCINTTARNFARIGKLYLNSGNWNGKQLLDSIWVAESIMPHKLPNKNNETTLYYGYQWWSLNDINKNIFYARGLNGQYVICFPEKNLIIVRIGEKRENSGNHPNDLLKYVAWGESL